MFDYSFGSDVQKHLKPKALVLVESVELVEHVHAEGLRDVFFLLKPFS